MIDTIFYILFIFTVGGSFFAIYSEESINNALGFLVTLISVAGIFALVGASFISLVQIIVYAGAILTLILLIIMFLNIKKENSPEEPNKLIYIFFCIIFLFPIDLLFIKSINNLKNTDLSPLESNFGSLKSVGLTLYNNWILPFEMISILLIVALIGATIFAKRRV